MSRSATLSPDSGSARRSVKAAAAPASAAWKADLYARCEERVRETRGSLLAGLRAGRGRANEVLGAIIADEEAASSSPHASRLAGGGGGASVPASARAGDAARHGGGGGGGTLSSGATDEAAAAHCAGCEGASAWAAGGAGGGGGGGGGRRGNDGGAWLCDCALDDESRLELQLALERILFARGSGGGDEEDDWSARAEEAVAAEDAELAAAVAAYEAGLPLAPDERGGTMGEEEDAEVLR